MATRSLLWSVECRVDSSGVRGGPAQCPKFTNELKPQLLKVKRHRQSTQKKDKQHLHTQKLNPTQAKPNETREIPLKLEIILHLGIESHSEAQINQIYETNNWKRVRKKGKVA